MRSPNGGRLRLLGSKCLLNPCEVFPAETYAPPGRALDIRGQSLLALDGMWVLLIRLGVEVCALFSHLAIRFARLIEP